MLGVFLVKTCVASSTAVTWFQVGCLVYINNLTLVAFVQLTES